MKEGRVVYHRARRALEEGGFNLRKWCTYISSLQEEMMVGEKSAPEQVSTNVKKLSLNWDTECDQLYFKLNEMSYLHRLPPTRRSVLKLSAKVFDPLGF